MKLPNRTIKSFKEDKWCVTSITGSNGFNFHPEFYPYVRFKADCLDTLYFMIKQTLEAEKSRELFSRTILNEYSQPIGTISLYDVEANHGFLATWIGQPYFGMGYNRLAKEEFFDEFFCSKY